ncbi:hypothetical protein [Leptolyngbya sp. NIES-2104]|uniref:hypothetical protein n=1 Tax=Leptolyngbya sp. NIES-2104 TaxID=1552121 RepID=UPI00073F07A2|nr:hypothetical protein [Leptolyngbya sp. NIES-2104]
MIRKLGLWLIWLGFIVYVVWFAPPLNIKLLYFLNPVALSAFSMVGIWLLIYSCLIFADGRMQQIPAWGFMLASIASGTVGLIPYLALREPNDQFSGEKDPWLALLDSKATGIVLTISTVVFLLFAIVFGDWSLFVQSFQTDKFIHGMSLALVLFALLFPYPTLLSDDMARRGLIKESQFFWIVALIPLFGPLAYLCLRPNIPTLK